VALSQSSLLYGMMREGSYDLFRSLGGLDMARLENVCVRLLTSLAAHTTPTVEVQSNEVILRLSAIAPLPLLVDGLRAAISSSPPHVLYD
jgi:hypothetical protein